MQRGVLLFWVLLLSARTLHAQTPLVGDLGDWRQWEITGVETFEVEQVREELAYDPDLLLAARPAAPRDELAAAIQQRTTDGYRRVGFPQARVDATVSASRVAIAVDEGQRYVAGEIRVTGVRGELATQIRTALMQPTEQSDDAGQEKHALWVTGKPIPFDQLTGQQRRSAIKDVLEAQGYLVARFKTRFAFHDSGRADLIVTVEELGPSAVVEVIMIQGNDRSHSREIIAHLDLRLGMPYSSGVKQQILDRLRASGRFSKHFVTATPTAGSVTLTIHVEETPGVPPLPKPLSKEAEVMLRHHRWLVANPDKHDLVYAMNTPLGFVELVVSSSNGVVGTVWTNDDQDRLRGAFVFTEHAILLANYGKGNMLRVPRGDFGITVNQQLAVDARAARPQILRFNGEWKKGEGAPWLDVKEDLPPCYFVAEATLAKSVSWDGPILVLQTHAGQMRVDSQSGQLVEFSPADPSIRYGRETGRFRERQIQIQRTSVGLVDDSDPGSPVNSIVRYVGGLLSGDHDVLTRSPTFRLLALAGLLSERGLFDQLDGDFVDSFFSEKVGDQFVLPTSTLSGEPDAATVAAKFADLVFERNTWPWTITREIGFALAGHQQYSAREWSRLIRSEDFGPIGHFTLMTLFELFGGEEQVVIVAASAHRPGRLSAAAFRRDVRQLLGNNDQAAAAILESLAQMQEEDIHAFSMVIGVDAKQLTRIVEAARSAPKGQQPSESLADLLVELWSREWQAAVQTHFWQLLDQHGPGVLTAEQMHNLQQMRR